jgi:hypothetical protein
VVLRVVVGSDGDGQQSAGPIEARDDHVLVFIEQ